MGNRITKIVKPDSDPLNWKYTHYVRDAGGNTMATYKKENISQATSNQLTERHIYGSSRLGIDTKTIELIGYTHTDGIYRHEVGLKNYELTNHFGNVYNKFASFEKSCLLIVMPNTMFCNCIQNMFCFGINAVITDRKIPRSTNGTNIDYYMPDIISATDYYPFGMPMPARSFSGEKYRFGFNGQEKDNEISGDGNSNTAEYWQYDTRLGRRWNIDPKPNMSISNYSVFANNPNWFSDLKGDTLEVEGDAEFRKNTEFFLQQISATVEGKKVVDILNNSTEKYTINEEFFARSSNYNDKTINYDDSPWVERLEGGMLNGMLTLGHELYHAYQDETNHLAFINRATAETEASHFQNYLCSVYSFGAMRTSYGAIPFSSDEKVYNPLAEKIKNFIVSTNMQNEPPVIVNGGNASDNTQTVTHTQQLRVNSGFTITYEKSYTNDGKTIKQSIKKANAPRISY